MSAYETKPFDSAIEPICMRIKEILYELPLLHQQAINEIRLRVGRPVTLHTPTRVDILKHNGQPIVTEKQDIEESYRRISTEIKSPNYIEEFVIFLFILIKKKLKKDISQFKAVIV